MLVISRKKNESIVVDHDILITVVEIRGDKVRLGIVAPGNASVHREEIYELIQKTRIDQRGHGRQSFAAVRLDPEWRSSTVIALAQTMCESGDFSALPILADALQDAGCNNDDILSHCRASGATHSRGSWVVDLVLGKS
jgi:carbon storage regulator CsrA